MDITVLHNQTATGDATETVLQNVQMPEVWQNAFFQFKSLAGDLVFMVPISRIAGLRFSNNTIRL